jgi:hypothetical protein
VNKSLPKKSFNRQIPSAIKIALFDIMDFVVFVFELEVGVEVDIGSENFRRFIVLSKL